MSLQACLILSVKDRVNKRTRGHLGGEFHSILCVPIGECCGTRRKRWVTLWSLMRYTKRSRGAGWVLIISPALLHHLFWILPHWCHATGGIQLADHSSLCRMTAASVSASSRWCTRAARLAKWTASLPQSWAWRSGVGFVSGTASS